MPISIQTTVSISIIKLDDWVAGLHFIREIVWKYITNLLHKK